MAMILQCPHLVNVSSIYQYCLLGKFPINCEACNCEDKRYIEVKTASNSYG